MLIIGLLILSLSFDFGRASQRWISEINNHERQVYSQNGEDGVLEFIFENIGTTNKIYVEFGTEDAKECNTRYLREEKGWNVKESLLMDGSHENPEINLKRVIFWPDNILELFTMFSVSREFDLLSVDMDSYEWWMVERILEGGYRPRVIVTEYNMMMAINESKTILPPEDNKSWKMWDGSTRYYGSSILAVKYLMKRFNYSLIWCNLINCIGVLDSALGGSLDLGVADICRFSSLMSHYAFEANRCDPGGRALAIITPGGRWRGETDNGQGSPGMRCDQREYERGHGRGYERRGPSLEQELAVRAAHPGCFGSSYSARRQRPGGEDTS